MFISAGESHFNTEVYASGSQPLVDTGGTAVQKRKARFCLKPRTHDEDLIPGDRTNTGVQQYLRGAGLSGGSVHSWVL